MPQYRHHSARRAGGKHLDEESALQAQIRDLYPRSGGESALPKLEGYNYRPVDTSTLEVEVLREQGINSVFSQLSAQGIQVLSMRNKANRLEELFVSGARQTRRQGMTHLYWVALKSIWAKEINRFMRIWVQTSVPPVITMTLYFIIFGNLIGSRIGEMHGFTYMQFIVPGLIMMAVITNAYANVASSFFSAKFQRNIEELLVAPVPTHVIIAGYVGGGVARGLCVGIR